MRFYLLSWLCAAGFTLAQSPVGVWPQVPNPLIVTYGGQQIPVGSNVQKTTLGMFPQLGLPPGSVSNGQKFLFIMLDIDANGAVVKVQQTGSYPTPSAAMPMASSIAAAAPSGAIAPDLQPADPQHLGGASTHLMSMVQDFSFTTSLLGATGGTYLAQGNNGPVPYIIPNPIGGHRYLMLLLDQPTGWSVPPAVQSLMDSRSEFDIRAFVNQSGLGVPRYGSWFVVVGDGKFPIPHHQPHHH
ncbi:hypothetical protein BT63DRAFT_152008 [Microthyrium microscopicum]|uniref:PEBP-like protein n=1 Tax=Microthyrium microscopicum TaxID=703497 RepID=A0A6A6UNI7_9PEZI|nr:hypothetical protein BT63DRAFT_152008 [Microthyrium microscopicum]